jgi:U32 family peptidase
MSQQIPFAKPEIMSPAGYWPQLKAAVEAGADSVYFGLKHFTARAKVGFSLAELPDALAALHERGVKGFVTFNSLVFDHEIDEAARVLAAIAEAGADAVIVQDLGVLDLVRRIAPELVIHASTQMSVTSVDGVRLAERLGASRVTLARELSFDDIRAIRAATGCELEIFVHGALCVAYSGQCFSSEAWGGRSANRGRCAQACRLPYDLVVDGRTQPLGDARYLLSPGDLYALEQMPEIVRLSLSALKIEGRYKDADYVALVTHAYREALDQAWAGTAVHVDAAERIRLEQVYSRGFGPHFLTGTNHQAVVRGRSPRHRGVQVGRVTMVAGASVMIEASEVDQVAPLKPGDGLVFDAADWRSPEEPEEGGRLYGVARARGSEIELSFGNGAIDFRRIRAGDLVWRSDDPDLERSARPFTAPSAPVAKLPVRVRVTAAAGSPLEAEWVVVKRSDVRVTVVSEAPLAAAQTSGVGEELVREQFGRLGNTPFVLAEVELIACGTPFVPVSLLNQLRRSAVERLIEQLRRPPAPVVRDAARSVAEARAAIRPVRADGHGAAQLHLLVRTPEQLEAALDARPASITLDYLDLYGLRPSVERVQAAGITARVAAPRVLKPGEERILEFLLRLDCGILVRSAGILDALRDHDHPPLTGDFSLNAANALAAQALLQLGLIRVTPTHDLNAAQITALARAVGGDRIEAVAYQHLPVFHTEHCVFCRFLSSGTSYRDCGRPCETHRVSLRDAGGREHPVAADVGCRNTVFGAEAQQAGGRLEDWQAAGIRHFRLEFVDESAELAARVARAFAQALEGRLSAAELESLLARIAPQGTTEGSLYVPKDYLSLPILQ